LVHFHFCLKGIFSSWSDTFHSLIEISLKSIVVEASDMSNHKFQAEVFTLAKTLSNLENDSQSILSFASLIESRIISLPSISPHSLLNNE